MFGAPVPLGNDRWSHGGRICSTQQAAANTPYEKKELRSEILSGKVAS